MEQIIEKGFIPVMLTPFKENGEIDYEALTRLTEFYLNAGASGLFANCLSSEMYELTMKERLQIIDHIVKNVHGRVPVVATGSFGNSLVEHADSVKRIYDKGVKSVILITSLLADEEESDVVFENRVFNLLDITGDVPLGFYECPVPYKRILLPEQLSRFVDTGRVIYHKDTSLDINSIRGKLEASKRNNDFGLYDAYIGNAIDSLLSGAAGLSCIQGNYFPELIVWLCKNYTDTRAKEVQQFFLDNMHVMHHIYPVVAKYALQRRGCRINTFTRRQTGIFTHHTSEALLKLQNDYNALIERLNLEMTEVV